MAIPDYQTIMLPLLQVASDREAHAVSEAREYLAAQFKLSQAERKQLLPSGTDEIFRNRVGWARLFLSKAGLIEATGRGLFKITKRGLEVLAQNPPKIDVKFLAQYPEFIAFQGKSKTQVIKPKSIVEQTPEETLQYTVQEMQKSLAQELLAQVKAKTPTFFEKLVVDLLVEMGYGGSKEDVLRDVGGIGDEGIDGIIRQDKLGLDAVYIQAKLWQTTIGRPEMQKFAGALQGQRARKGIFVTTSSFSKEARDFVSKIDSKIVLIDGEQLAQLMIKHDVGVQTANTLLIKKIDQDYFTEE